MSEFRAALEQFLAGTLGADDTRQRVRAAAIREPQAVPAMLAVIEAYRSGQRLTPEFAAELQQLIRQAAGLPTAATAPDEPTHLSVAPAPGTPTAVSAAPSPGPATPPPPTPTAQTPQTPQTPPPLPSDPPSLSSATPVSSARSWSVGASGMQVRVGTVLKDRFVLETLVAGGDKGGMGMVFKALDRIKQEAQDRNPYVAIKVLNEDFKHHPDSMIALQREARRAQTLAHPNVITVYDFDRDGDTVYMAMELLSGSTLDDVIRSNRDRGGLPVNEALQIITQLGRGLGYAHANNIVHSDFKPGNAFLTKEGVVKVLDFGIARAIKLPDGEKTRFDAGSLGAMTLPYASCEQLERQDPDPSDDVYALSVVSYELLTGRHPFERPDPNKPGRVLRTDAVSARSAKMKPAPAPIPGLSRAQWRTLRRGLSFNRADRPRNGAEFLEGMTPRKLAIGTLLAAVTAGVLLLITTTLLINAYLQKSRLEALTQRLQSSDPTLIAAALQSLQKYSPAQRAQVLLNDAVQGSLVNYYIQHAHEQFNIEAGRYDYAGAIATLREAQGLSRAYEDSRQLNDALDKVESDRKAEILKQAAAFESQLDQGVLIASQGPQNVRSTLASIRQLDPNYPLLNDKRLPIAFANQVRSNIDSGHLAIATALLAAGLQFAPNDPGLLDLQDRVTRQQNSVQLSAQADEFEQAVRPLGQPRATLADFRAKLPQLQSLRRAQPNSAVLLAAQDQLGRLIDPIVSSAVAQHQVAEAQATVNEFSDLLPAAVLARQRTQIASVTGNTQARDDTATQLRAKIEQETASPQSDDASVSTLLRDLQDLQALAGASDPGLAQARERVSQAYLNESKSLLAKAHFTESQHLLDLAKQFGLRADTYQAQSLALSQAGAQADADSRARENAAQLTVAKQRVLDEAAADHIDVAQSRLSELRKSLPATDPFATTDAPRAIAEAYLERARRAAQQVHFDQALQEVQQAQQMAPNLPDMQAEVQLFQSARDLARQLAVTQDFRSLAAQLDQVREAERTRGSHSIAVGLSRLVAERLNRLEAQDPKQAATLRASAAPYFPNLSRAIASPANQVQAQNSAPSVAPAPTSPLQTTTPQTTTPQNAPPQNAPGPVPPPAVQPSPSKPQRQPATSNAPSAFTGRETATQVSAPTAMPTAPTGPCGATSPGSTTLTFCRDALSKGGKGPEMVLIPAGLELGAYAIMRDEASVGDYDAYCSSTKACAPVSGSDADTPIVNVSYDSVQKYATWLSQSTGAKYRLPTQREWLRAAGRNMTDPDANCVVPGRDPRGTTLRPTTAGQGNAFGMRNVVGNAQEWVTTANGGLRAFGGAIGDPMYTCQTEFSRASNGEPDARTGFRLLREMQ